MASRNSPKIGKAGHNHKLGMSVPMRRERHPQRPLRGGTKVLWGNWVWTPAWGVPTGGTEVFSILGCFENFFLTFVWGCAKFGGVTGCEEDTHPLGNAQRRAGWCKAPRMSLDDTTSEPFAGNGKPGAPVKASMSGGVFRHNQGGTVEYFVSHP